MVEAVAVAEATAAEAAVVVEAILVEIALIVVVLAVVVLHQRNLNKNKPKKIRIHMDLKQNKVEMIL